jgi:hypothetical protein
LLVDGGENLGRAALERPVRNSRNAERALLLFAGLRDIDASDIRRSITASVDGLEHWLNPSPKALLRLLHRLPINSSGRAIWNLRQTLPHSVARDVMGQRGEAEFRFTSSFRCYLLKFRFHGQLDLLFEGKGCVSH